MHRNIYIQKIYQIFKKLEYYSETSNKHIFNVCQNEKEKEMGLMYIKIPLDTGMLFEYEDISYPSMDRK